MPIIYCVSSKTDLIRRSLYLVSTVIVTAPFLVTDPVTPRCFFAAYVFWAVFSGDLLISVLPETDGKRAFRTISALVAAGGCLYFGFTQSCNKYVELKRMDIIKEQLAGRDRIVTCLKLPYPEQVMDSIKELFILPDEEELAEHKYYYINTEMLYYYGIREEDVTKQPVHIEAYEYFE